MARGLWERASEDLRIKVRGDPADLIVWEHSARVAHLSQIIADLPDIAPAAVDRTALTAACLYHDAGWVLQVHAGATLPRDVLLRPTGDLLREMAADWMASRLASIVPPGPLQLAARAIRQCNDRDADLIEARILAEAENLDEIGPSTIALLIRKMLAEGRTLDSLVAAWERQEEYHYWQARIKDCFKFPAVRAIAEQRWKAMGRFMADLRASIRVAEAPLAPSSSPPV